MSTALHPAPSQGRFPLGRRALLLLLALAWLPAVGCGPSVPELVSHYLQAVRMQERRLQDAAEDLADLAPRMTGGSSVLAEVQAQVRLVQERVRQARADTEKLHAPPEAEAYSKMVLEAFDLAGQRVDRLQALLEEEDQLLRADASGQAAVHARIRAIQADLSALAGKSAEVEKKIEAEKRRLIDAFNLHVPGEDPPASPKAPGGA